MKFKNVAFFVMLIFGFVGVVFSSYIVHEWVHWSDCHANVVSDEICIINIMGDWSGVKFFTAPFATYQGKLKEGMSCKPDEFKAYSVQSVIMLLFLVSEYFVVNNWRKEKW